MMISGNYSLSKLQTIKLMLSKPKRIIKEKYNNYLENDKIDGIQELGFMLKIDFKDYCDRNITFKMMFWNILFCIWFWINTFRFLILALTDDPNILILFGDPLHITGNRKLFNSFLFLCALSTTLFNTAFIIGIKYRKLHFIQILYNIQIG